MLAAPHRTLADLARALPAEMRDDVIIVGSLAAAARFFPSDESLEVRTKDIDCMLSPRLRALIAGRQATEVLLDAGWTMHPHEKWDRPGDAQTSKEKLPVVRLVPPSGGGWFLELLAAPDPGQTEGRCSERLETRHGHFLLYSFRFLGLAECDPLPTGQGLRIARPEMMALANLLHHPAIGPEVMSGLIERREVKRANKDLGRVLALAYLAEQADESALESWPAAWLSALWKVFPEEWPELLPTVGTGLEILLSDSHRDDLDEAHHSCIAGLLAGYRPAVADLRAVGRRLIVEVVGPVRTGRDARP